AIFKPEKVGFGLVVIPRLVVLGCLGIFRRVREFVRKPYVIGSYMYLNLLREGDYPFYRKDRILKHATYTSVHEITPDNKVMAGRDVFMLTCSRCHTTNGVNSIVDVFENMYGKDKPLNEQAMASYIPGMHQGRAFMPPFPGNKKELEALVAYIKQLQSSGESLQGAQTDGVDVNPDNAVDAVAKRIEAEM